MHVITQALKTFGRSLSDNLDWFMRQLVNILASSRSGSAKPLADFSRQRFPSLFLSLFYFSKNFLDPDPQLESQKLIIFSSFFLETIFLQLLNYTI